MPFEWTGTQNTFKTQPGHGYVKSETYSLYADIIQTIYNTASFENEQHWNIPLQQSWWAVGYCEMPNILFRHTYFLRWPNTELISYPLLLWYYLKRDIYFLNACWCKMAIEHWYSVLVHICAYFHVRLKILFYLLFRLPTAIGNFLMMT